MSIANNFITERNSSEVMTVGLNSVREICARAPLCMNETLLQDLAQYKSHKDKGITRHLCHCQFLNCQSCFIESVTNHPKNSSLALNPKTPTTK